MLGAMENWGLIAGSTSCFAMDPASEDLGTKKDIATTVCHEVAHMWCVLLPDSAANLKLRHVKVRQYYDDGMVG